MFQNMNNMKKKTIIICIAIGVALVISLIVVLCNKQTPGGLFSNPGNQVTNDQNYSDEDDVGNQVREDASEKQGLSADGQNTSDNTVIYKEEILVEPEKEGDIGVGISVESDNSSVESIFGNTETQSSATQENRQTSSSKSSDTNVSIANNNESQTESQQGIESETELATERETEQETEPKHKRILIYLTV